MSTQKFEYKPENVAIVPVGSVKDSGYNPKEETPPDYEKVKRSIEVNGMMTPVIVRDDDKDKKSYILVDGHQRFRAAQELGYTDVPVYSLGNISESKAKALTVWFQEAKTPFNEVDLSHLVVELANLEAELPFNEVQIENFRNMAEFDFDYSEQNDEEDESDLDDEFVKYNLKLTQQQLDTFKRAVEDVQEKEDCSEGRAVELLAMAYLGDTSGE